MKADMDSFWLSFVMNGPFVLVSFGQIGFCDRSCWINNDHGGYKIDVLQIQTLYISHSFESYVLSTDEGGSVIGTYFEWIL